MRKPITARKETSLCAVFCQQSIPWINIFIICNIIRRRIDRSNVRTVAGVVSGVTVITGVRQIVKGTMGSILTRCQSRVFIVVIVKPPVRAYPSVWPPVVRVERSASGACGAAERVFCAHSSPDESVRPPHHPPLVALAGRSIQSLQLSLAQPFS